MLAGKHVLTIGALHYTMHRLMEMPIRTTGAARLQGYPTN